jgi:hypothetical protein
VRKLLKKVFRRKPPEPRGGKDLKTLGKKNVLARPGG